LDGLGEAGDAAAELGTQQDLTRLRGLKIKFKKTF
jgi:hypothetical protein